MAEVDLRDILEPSLLQNSGARILLGIIWIIIFLIDCGPSTTIGNLLMLLFANGAISSHLLRYGIVMKQRTLGRSVQNWFCIL